jgi:hypothetical protein
VADAEARQLPRDRRAQPRRVHAKPDAAAVFERDGDLVVDRFSFDVTTGRETTERWMVRGGNARKTEYSVRFYTYTELRDLLLDVGFSSVEGVGHDGEALTLESRRMIVIATR